MLSLAFGSLLMTFFKLLSSSEMCEHVAIDAYFIVSVHTNQIPMMSSLIRKYVSAMGLGEAIEGEKSVSINFRSIPQKAGAKRQCFAELMFERNESNINAFLTNIEEKCVKLNEYFNGKYVSSKPFSLAVWNTVYMIDEFAESAKAPHSIIINSMGNMLYDFPGRGGYCYFNKLFDGACFAGDLIAEQVVPVEMLIHDKSPIVAILLDEETELLGRTEPILQIQGLTSLLKTPKNLMIFGKKSTETTIQDIPLFDICAGRVPIFRNRTKSSSSKSSFVIKLEDPKMELTNYLTLVISSFTLATLPFVPVIMWLAYKREDLTSQRSEYTTETATSH